MTDPRDLFIDAITHQTKKIIKANKELDEATSKRSMYVTQFDEWARRKEGAKSPCVLCEDPTLDYFEVVKKFYLDQVKMIGNICKKHTPILKKKHEEFLKN